MRAVYYLVFLSFAISSCRPQEVRTEYTLDEIDLVPEGIAYSHATKLFYLTSIAKSKIITLNDRGEQNDFVTTDQGFIPGVGIYVDDENEIVYALGGYFMRDSIESTLFKFDLRSGKLLSKYAIPGEGRHFMNDLVASKAGDIYITDTEAASVYVLRHESANLDLFMQHSELEWPNGIAISGDDRHLYVASFSKGVRVIDINTKKIINDADTLGISQGIDGLEFYHGNLYAVQNGVKANSDNFRKLILDEKGIDIADVKVIDSKNPALNLPLTFCIANQRAVLIANSNLQYFDQVKLEPMYSDSLRKTKLMIYNLE